MNFPDSEIVASILSRTKDITQRKNLERRFVLVNTCSIRDKMEQTVRKRLRIYALKINPTMKVEC